MMSWHAEWSASLSSSTQHKTPTNRHTLIHHTCTHTYAPEQSRLLWWWCADATSSVAPSTHPCAVRYAMVPVWGLGVWVCGYGRVRIKYIYTHMYVCMTHVVIQRRTCGRHAPLRRRQDRARVEDAEEAVAHVAHGLGGLAHLFCLGGWRMDGVCVCV